MPRISKRNRLFSESASTDQHHHEPLKGILKNARIPTKRSVSECVDDLSHYMDDLDINIDDLKSRRFCPLHPFPEHVEIEQYSCDEDDGDVDDGDDDSQDGDDEHDYENQNDSGNYDQVHDIIKQNEKCIDKHKKRIVIDTDVKTSNKLSEKHDNNLDQNNSNKTNQVSEDEENVSIKNKKHAYSYDNQNNENENENVHGDTREQLYSKHGKELKGCACYDRYRSDSSDGSNELEDTKPRKKSVRFDDHVYETVFIASRLYDRRAMAKYRFSTRHHPQPNGKQNKKQSKKRTAKLSKSETKQISPIVTSKHQKSSDNKGSHETSGNQSEAQQTNGCRMTKSQRSKQSKKDKLKIKLRRKEESCSSDDQGYGSSILNLSE